MKPSATPCLDAFERTMARLRSSGRNAAMRNKPTMWAYYGRTEERLRAWFAEQVDAATAARAAITPGGKPGSYSFERARMIDGGISGAALALVQRAERECPMMPRDEAAELWAMGTYAAGFIRAWGIPVERRSLQWLRDRANTIERLRP